MVTGATSSRQKGLSSPPVRASRVASCRMSKPSCAAVWRPLGRPPSMRRARAMVARFIATPAPIVSRHSHSGKGKCRAK
ncbi:hypothetical protein D3C85_1196860 [compost metagenome]